MAPVRVLSPCLNESILPPTTKQILGMEILRFTLFEITLVRKQRTEEIGIRSSGLLLIGARGMAAQRVVCGPQSSPRKPVPPKPVFQHDGKKGGSHKELLDAMERNGVRLTRNAFLLKTLL